MNWICGPDDGVPSHSHNSRAFSALEGARQKFPEMRSWRRDIHRHPERSFQEYRTAQYIADILRAIPGMEVETGVAGTTAVVGRIGGRNGRHVAIRADMDALPITEKHAHEFRSEIPGMMHACGHDGHIAIALGTAHLMGDCFMRGQMPGRVTFIFQPAEETPNREGKTGAPCLVEAGILDDVDEVLALHMDPEQPVGAIRLQDGPCMASVDNFRVQILGKGGHAGYPQLTADPLWLMIPVLQAIHGIAARRVSPLEPAVVSVCRVAGGTTNNVIPPDVEFEGTLRSYDANVRDTVIHELERACAIAENLGGEYRLRVERCEPATVNDARINRVLEEVIREITGSDPLRMGPFGMGGEDFGFMTQKVPGSLFFLGCAPREGDRVSLHSPEFDLNEEALPLGAAVLAETIGRLLTRDLSGGR